MSMRAWDFEPFFGGFVLLVVGLLVIGFPFFVACSWYKV